MSQAAGKFTRSGSSNIMPKTVAKTTPSSKSSAKPVYSFSSMGWSIVVVLVIVGAISFRNGDHLRETYHFQDQALGIEFDYPKSWGLAKGELQCYPHSEQEGDVGGCEYNFTFGSRAGASTLAVNGAPITAGGRSREFAEARGSYIADDGVGFGDKTQEQVCAEFGGVECTNYTQGRDPKVISMIRVPKSENISSPGGYPFSVLAAVDLGEDRPVQGLVFEYSFLSDYLNRQISKADDDVRLAWEVHGESKAAKDAEEAFDLKMEHILAAVQNRVADEETMSNLQEFSLFAESIKIH